MNISFIYSETIVLFLKKIRAQAQIILKNEMGISVGTRRFWIKKTGYPLHFVVFEHPSKLGYFDPELYEIGVNKCYLFESHDELKDLLRHELAHYITFIEYGPTANPHGKEFRTICQKYGWKPDISRASSSPEKKRPSMRLVAKVQKLLALSESHHPKEAELAMLKAHELLRKYNLETPPPQDEEEMVVERLFKQSRSTSKLQAIASILKHFFVCPVFNHGKGCVYLEILGSRVNLEIASYVGKFLEHELERLWQNVNQLKGLRAKNSFFRGIAEGYALKMKPPSKEKPALMILENQLTQAKQLAYPHLSSTFHKGYVDSRAQNAGRAQGKKLSIRPAMQEKKIKKLKFIK